MKLKLLSLIFVPLILSLMISSVHADTKTITPSDDVFVWSTDPDKNYNYNPFWLHLPVRRIGSAYQRAWLKFTIPHGGTVETAQLYLYQWDGTFPPNPNVTIHYSTNDSWTENTITWNNQPSYGDAIDFEIVSTPDAWYSWNVTSVVSSGDTVSFVLKTTTDNGETFFCSKENDETNPYLYITYGYAGSEEGITIVNVPLMFGIKLGISTWSAGIILTALFIFPLNMILVLWKKGGIITLILNLTFLGLFASISWLPGWIFLLIILIVTGLFGVKMKGIF